MSINQATVQFSHQTVTMSIKHAGLLSVWTTGDRTTISSCRRYNENVIMEQEDVLTRSPAVNQWVPVLKSSAVSVTV